MASRMCAESGSSAAQLGRYVAEARLHARHPYGRNMLAAFEAFDPCAQLFESALKRVQRKRQHDFEHVPGRLVPETEMARNKLARRCQNTAGVDEGELERLDRVDPEDGRVNPRRQPTDPNAAAPIAPRYRSGSADLDRDPAR